MGNRFHKLQFRPCLGHEVDVLERGGKFRGREGGYWLWGRVKGVLEFVVVFVHGAFSGSKALCDIARRRAREKERLFWCNVAMLRHGIGLNL